MKPEEIGAYINSRLKYYLQTFLLTFKSNETFLTEEDKDLIYGTLVYLISDNDYIPDDVPHIGYFDDMRVFVEATRYFLAKHPETSDLIDRKALVEDLDFIEKCKGITFDSGEIDIRYIKALGKKNTMSYQELSKEVMKKYASL